MSAFEKHDSVNEIAEQWGLSRKTVTKLFINEPGVIKLGSPSRLVGRGKYKRKYYTLKIPESVKVRVYEKITKQ